MLLNSPCDAAAQWTLPGVGLKLSGVADPIVEELRPLSLSPLGRRRER